MPSTNELDRFRTVSNMEAQLTTRKGSRKEPEIPALLLCVRAILLQCAA